MSAERLRDIGKTIRDAMCKLFRDAHKGGLF